METDVEKAWRALLTLLELDDNAGGPSHGEKLVSEDRSLAGLAETLTRWAEAAERFAGRS